MDRNAARIFDGISIFFLAMTAVVLIFVVIKLLGPSNEEPVALGAVPTPFVLPTLPPTATPTATLRPSVTPTPTDTLTPTITPSETATIPPSQTITDTPGPTDTPSVTPTPSTSPTPTPTETPTGPTPTYTPSETPFFFDISGGIVFYPNSGNSAGCVWQGLGGSVLDRNGLEMVGRQFQIHVYGNGFEQRVLTGTNTVYGATTGWEIAVGQAPSAATYYVRLETTSNTPISPDIQVTFPGTCETNAAIIRFAQIRDFGPPPAATAPGP